MTAESRNSEQNSVLKITPEQCKRVNTLVRRRCCNCDRGNCLLLDDGEANSCVQLICQFGITCSYFKNAVLPSDRELYAEITNDIARKTCVLCHGQFVPRAKNQLYCPDCAAKRKRQRTAGRQMISVMRKPEGRSHPANEANTYLNERKESL